VNAAEIATALGGARRKGRHWRCPCPLHGGHSLELCDGDNGCVLVTCWAGCDRLDVLAELRRCGLLGEPAVCPLRIISPSREHDNASRIARAMKTGATRGMALTRSRAGIWRAAALHSINGYLRYASTHAARGPETALGI
jgi:hypothetical protein